MKNLNWRRVCGVLLAALTWTTAAQAQEVLVAAASDLQHVLPQIASQFQKDTGQTVKLSFGASGNFARQIAQGAPYQVFLSADENFVRQVEQQGFAMPQQPSKLYAQGQLVLWVPKKADIALDPELKGLRQALAAGRVQRLAMANPQHAPYGRAAQAALQKAQLWEGLQGKLVLGENIVQTAQFASSGSTQGGFISLSLARTPAMQALGEYVPILPQLYPPIRQRMVVLKGADKVAQQFFAYMQQAPAQTILKAHGFSMPDKQD